MCHRKKQAESVYVKLMISYQTVQTVDRYDRQTAISMQGFFGITIIDTAVLPNFFGICGKCLWLWDKKCGLNANCFFLGWDSLLHEDTPPVSVATTEQLPHFSLSTDTVHVVFFRLHLPPKFSFCTALSCCRTWEVSFCQRRVWYSIRWIQKKRRP